MIALKTLVLFLGLLAATALLMHQIAAIDHNEPSAKFRWDASPYDAVVGYLVEVRDVVTHEVIYRKLTDQCEATVPLDTWQQAVDVRAIAVVPYWCSDYSDTIAWSQAGWVGIEPQGESIQIKTAPVPSTIQSSNNLKQWNTVGETDSGSYLVPATPTQQFFRVRF